MDKNAIKTFAVESRRKMIKSVKFQASLLGITADGIKEPISKAEGMETYDYGAGQHTIYDEDIKKRESLVREINNKGFDNVVEEVAYTWFNRIIAIRYMEVNDYLPTYTRVLSSEIEGKIEPDIITEALDLDLDYSDEDREKILKFKMDNDNDKLFQFLFIKQCNKLNEILPGLFEKTDDYMELLLDIKCTDEDSVVRQLVDTISEEDFGNQVEIIGWLYQYYNSELKDLSYENLNKNKIKFSKNSIPAATQIFTPDWIVKYMVENSLGKLWLEHNDDLNIKKNWRYFVDEIEQDSDINNTLLNLKNNYDLFSVEDLKIIDPCMGSGHILVYVFDVLLQIYMAEGFSERDATILILKNNLFGLDIDVRASQMAYFSIMMKARKHNRRIFNENIYPNLYAIKESNILKNSNFIEHIYNVFPEYTYDLNNLINNFLDARLYGSLLELNNVNLKSIKSLINELKKLVFTDFFYLNNISEINLLEELFNQSQILNNKYDVSVTNPPYMKKGNMDNKLIDFLNKNFSDYKMDFLTAFMKRCFSFTKDGGFSVLVTTSSWMFSSVYSSVREDILKNKTIYNILYMGPQVLGIGFESSASVFRNIHLSKYNGVFDIINMEHIKNDIPFTFPSEERYISSVSNFYEVPSKSIAFWGDSELISSFKKGIPLNQIADLKVGLQTGDNSRFLRNWYEVNKNDFKLNYISCEDSKKDKLKWFPYNKGGDFRKWYGNQGLLVNWYDDGFEIRNFKGSNGKLRSRPQNTQFYFNQSISWSKVSKGNISFRYFPEGFIFDSIGCSIFLKDQEYKYYILGLLNSNVSQAILKVISPTLGSQVGDIGLIPVLKPKILDKINGIVKQNIDISKKDWDEKETSWNFSAHPFFMFEHDNFLKLIFKKWEDYKLEKFNLLKSNEIELNNILAEIYSVKMDPKIDDKYISLYKSNYKEDIRSFISYAVGCMFGRYSLDEEGLQFAGGEFNINNYSKFIPDDDNIIPVLDTEYFNDDIVGRFVEFVKVCFGEETLEENLDFIAGALKKKGKTSREIIRNYFLTDFFKDHAQTYKKTPIYWQFDSGKQNAFKCLIYMHRYEPGLVARVRTDYLHKTQKAIEQNLAQCESIISNSSNKSEVSKATKDKSKYIKQLDEIKVYDEALAHIANQRIEIDLDDGVKVNHAKFQNVEISKEGQKAKKINLLKKI